MFTKDDSDNEVQFWKVFDSLYKTTPLFIYDENDNDKLLVELKTRVAGSGVKVTYIDKSKVAIACRTSERMKSTGVYLCKRKFSRGLDIKFKVDAHTLIIARAVGIPWSEKVQMAGRSCRSQGVSRATYFTYLLDAESPFEASLKGLEFNVHEGAELLKMAYERWPSLNSIQRIQVNLAFKNGGWMMKKVEMERKYLPAWNMLSVPRSRENSSATQKTLIKEFKAPAVVQKDVK